MDRIYPQIEHMIQSTRNLARSERQIKSDKLPDAVADADADAYLRSIPI
jgi:hypothetical protein